jgi:adenylate cyclase
MVMLRSLLEIKSEDPAIETRQRIESTLIALDPSLAEGLPMLFDFLELANPDESPEILNPETHQRWLLGYIIRVLHATSQGRTCVFVVEDLQWFDPSSELFLEKFIDSIEETKTLLLVNFRPDYHPAWMATSCYQQLPLRMLDEASVMGMLAQLLGDHPSVSDLPRAIYDRCRGNPFFIEEVVYSLVDQEVLVGERQHYQLTTPIPQLAVPATVQAVLEARIDQLPDREKQLLQTASVIGGRFHAELIRDVLTDAPIEIDAALKHLVRLDFVFESARHPSTEYTFTHPLILEVAYHSQLNDSRAQIHRRVAEALEARSEADSDGRNVELAYHWEEAQVHMKAARWHARAGEGFGLRNVQAAERHWRSVLELIEETPECAEKARLGLTAQIWLLRLSWRLGFGRDEVRHIFREGLDLAHRTQDDHGRAILMLCYANQCAAEGNHEDHRRHVEEACRISEQLHSPGLERASRLALVNGLSVQGRLDAALEISEDEDTGAAWQPSSNPGRGAETHRAYSLASMARLHSMTGQLNAAGHELERADAIARKLEEPEMRGHLHNIRVHHALNTGDRTMALAHGIEATRLADETGMPRLRADAYASFGDAQLLAEDWHASIGSFNRARGIVGEREGLASMLPRILLGISQAELGLGNFQQALATLETILSRPELAETRILELNTQLTLARALLRAHGSDAADAIQKAISSALELVEETGARAYRPVVHRILAEVAQVIGDEATRRLQLEKAHRLYREMGATGHAQALAPEISLEVA